MFLGILCDDNIRIVLVGHCIFCYSERVPFTTCNFLSNYLGRFLYIFYETLNSFCAGYQSQLFISL